MPRDYLSRIFLDWAASWTPLAALAWTLAGNLGSFTLTLVLGHVLVRRFAPFPVSDPPPPLTNAEVGWATVCVLLNSLVTFAGWFLWRAGWITVRTGGSVFRMLWDALVLLVLMDIAMYVLHRTAHHKWFFGWLHKLHHVYDNPRPLTLFVMNPLEVLAFGGLWLVLLCAYSASFAGIALYLTLNIAFGLAGHLGVEPFPARWATHPVLRYLGGSAFHARHHHDGAVNFGFYTTFWDKLGGTLGPPPSPSVSPSAAQSTNAAPGMRA